MALVTSRTDLSQGQSNSVAACVFATGTGADIRIHTGAANNLPALASGEFFEVRDHSLTNNNGLYQVVTVTTSTDDYECDKVFGTAPTASASETVTTLGATGAATEKSVFFDTTNNGAIAILEQGNVDAAGVTGQAVYSFVMQEWKDDEFIIANSPFPMLTIDSDAGKYIIGQDISGNSNGATWLDSGAFSIRTRKLLRNAGWDEVNSSGVTTARSVGVVTLGAFEAPTTDVAYYQFGTDTLVNDTVDFDFAGPVNEAVEFYTLIGDLTGDTPSFATTTTITRATGSFVTDGFKVGGSITIINSTSNDGDYTLDAVSATSMTISTTWTAEAWGTTQIAVNNEGAFTIRLRVRDGDPKGKTFGQANLATIDRTALGNFIYAFPLANATDQKIDAVDGDMTSAPYNGMTITFHSTPQARTDLVGGSANFGIIVDGNNGTAQQVFEFIQYSLRQTTDIDNDGDTAIGRTIDGLARFVGDTGEFGTADGLSFPSNPDGGGSGVYVDNLNSASKNSVTFYDNTNAPKTFPETISVTLDFNQIAIDDTSTQYDLFYDRTIRTTVADLVVNSGGAITSSGSNLPTNAEIAAGKYIRLAGLTGIDAAMNGVYQISGSPTSASYAVTRYDGAAMATTSSASVFLDQNCVDTPDAILVHTDVRVAEAAAAYNSGTATLSFTAPDTITCGNSTLGNFVSGMKVQIEGSTANAGIYEVDTASATTITLVEQTITTEAVGVHTDCFIAEVVSGLASVDYTFSFDFDNNEQGGRSVSTTTYVKAKAIGSTGAQYVQSSVADIVSGTPETIPVAPATERNYV